MADMGPIDRVSVGRCGAHATAAADALKALGAHQPADPVAADLDAATAHEILKAARAFLARELDQPRTR